MIDVRSLKKSFGLHPVLRGVEFCIAKGEAISIIGRSGGGKSVLLKHLIGLIQPDEGEVWIDGENIGHLSERRLLAVRRRFGMLFQGAALFDSLTVRENVSFLLRREGQLSRMDIDRRVDETLNMVELDGTQQKKPAELSGGMRKRVGLARAIIHRPEIILYDEPTTGLDPIVADSIDILILRVCEHLAVTSIAVTHDMRSARRISRRMMLLHDGRIYNSGTPDEFFSSTDPVVHRFVHGISDPKNHYF